MNEFAHLSEPGESYQHTLQFILISFSLYLGFMVASKFDSISLFSSVFLPATAGGSDKPAEHYLLRHNSRAELVKLARVGIIW